MQKTAAQCYCDTIWNGTSDVLIFPPVQILRLPSQWPQ